MYGLVNSVVEDLVSSLIGAAGWARVKRAAGVTVEVFVSMEPYDDDVTYRLVAATAAEMGLTEAQVLEAFGRHWVLYTGQSGYGALFGAMGTTMAQFLSNLDGLHTRVASSMPELRPPSFACEELPDGQLLVRYWSERPGLSPMVTGLLLGLAERFGLDVDVTLTPRSASADHDVFLVTRVPAGVPAAAADVTSGWGLPPDLLGRAFPFHVGFDADLVVRQVGDGLHRLCPEVAPGRSLTDVLSVDAPRGPHTWDSLGRAARSLFLLRPRVGDLVLRGQVLCDPEQRRGVFLGAPWVTDLDQIAVLGLSLEDFAVSDSIVDYLLLLQTQQHAQGQARALAARLEDKAAQLAHQAFHDSLTGLPNRALFADRFDQALRLTQRSGGAVGLLLLDLDRFKEINDTFGHHYGDELLRLVGPRLSSVLRSADTVARLGGDEFAVLLPDLSSVAAAMTVAGKLLACLAEPFRVEGVDLDVEASIGVVVSGEHGQDPSELLQRADVAMYVAKSQHLGVFAYDAAVDGHSPEKLALLGDLRRALDREQLVLHYQPKVEIASGRVIGVEALVRWQHPERGLVPPDDFIPLAEHTGLIGPLTAYVLDRALAQARRWSDTGRPLTVSVNLSARNLLDERLPGDVAALLARHGVPAGLLELEVTESAIITEPLRAQRLLGELAALGVRLSIDDFGAGYTSLGQLKTLPLDELKIDRSFVMTMGEDRSNALIVASVVDLGHNLGLTIVAEGVEDAASLATLAAYGCDVAQGYHLARPMPVDRFDAWLAGRAAGHRTDLSTEVQLRAGAPMPHA